MRRLSLLALVLLCSCLPAFQPSQAPQGASLTLEPSEGYTWVRLTVAAPVERGYLLISGAELAANAPECAVDSDADLRCTTGPFAESYSVAVAGTLDQASAVLCEPQGCYWLEPLP